MAEQKTILIVDDEETLTWSMSKNLSLNKGYKVICANSAEEALDIIQKTDGVDLVVSDIKMQGKNGLQLLSEVKAKYPKVGFIIMTAYGSNEKRQEALGKGAIRYLEKPFMMGQVKEVITEVLGEMDQLFQPVDEGLKNSIKNNKNLLALLLQKSQQSPELLNVTLVAPDGEPLLSAGNNSQQDIFRILFAVKVLKRMQAVSAKIDAGKMCEVVISTEKYNIFLRYLADNSCLLYLVFIQASSRGKAMLVVAQLEEQINKLLA